MLKIKTKFRCLIAVYMFIPIAVIIGYARGSSFFYDPGFQGALGVSVAVCILLAFCTPLLFGLRWLLFSQLTRVAEICTHIKNGEYAYFTLPNEPTDDSGENEMVALMRDMNWMIRQIETRETELENRVARRTRALKKSNAALVTARDAANDSARAKSEFLATMSHEIRTPMNAIIGMSSLAGKNNQDPGMDEYLSIIHTSSTALLGIINDILDFSKMDAGKLSLEAIPVNLRDLLEEICDMFKGQLAQGSVELILDIDPRVPATISGDPLRLRQVLTNLISNALKFTRDGEIVVKMSVVTSRDGSAALGFSVRDSGLGMDEASLKTLFTPFTQADGSITREFGGTGLGLAISSKLVALMGGEIRVESRKGKGSCFSFSLEVDMAQAREYRVPVLPDHFKGKSVTLAVENRAGEKILMGYLTGFGLNVLPAPPGEADPAPALAIVDTALEDAAVSSMIERIRAAGDGIPVVALGVLTEKNRGTSPAWADRFIPKPVKQSMLFDTLMEAFHGPRTPEKSPKADEHRPVPEQAVDILVVEDNRINQKVADEILRSVGIVPYMADSGPMAIKAVRERRFHAVLMDVQMPNMDGYQATEQIRKIHPGLPVIAMTANAMAEDREQGRRAGMAGYITKPVDPDTLFSTLETCLGISLGSGPAGDVSGENGQPDPDRVLPGIDAADALKRLRGNKMLLTQLILEFAEMHGDALECLADLARSRNVDGVTALAHQLKGLTANISANTLSSGFAGLEKKSRRMAAQSGEPDTAPLLSAIAGLGPAMAEVTGAARTLAPPQPLAPDTGEATDLPPDIPKMVDELGRLIEQNSLSAKTLSKDLAARLSSTAFRHRARQLEIQIKRFEFQKARHTFQDLENDIKARPAA